MKKIFQIIGLISLLCFSFFITEKTSVVVSEMDEIMLQINLNKEKYESEAIDAIIDEETIIPGISARSVNVNKSYKIMKESGYYNDKLLVFDYKLPNINLKDNINKIIIKGNPKKRRVSLVFRVLNSENIDDILKIINNYNVKVSFFVETSWFSENSELIQKLINDGHSVHVFMSNYSDSNYEWIDTVLKKVNHQKIGFCYNIDNNNDNIKECSTRGNYTIRPIEINSNTPFLEIKENLISGTILSLPINTMLKKELSTIIIYIKSKGFELTNLENNVLEQKY